jgi:hypothetical protein
MKSLGLCLHLLCLLLATTEIQSTADKVPTPYPSQFQINFVTNVTTDSGDGDVPVSGQLAYDWNRRLQRIDHGAGAYECVHFYGTDEPCSLLFNRAGMYRLLEADDSVVPSCCLDLEGIGPPPANWAQGANGTFNGLVYDLVSGLTAFQWTFDRLQLSPTVGTSNFHVTREVALGEYSGRPLTFTFPGSGRQDYHFDVQSMRVGQPDPSHFVLPDGCADRLCDAIRRTRGGN